MLYLPEHCSDLVTVTIPSQFTETELETAQFINNSGELWLAGKLDTGTYMDILDSVEIDPIEFLDSAEEYMDELRRCLT